MTNVFSFNPLKTLSVIGKLNETEFSENVCVRNNDLSVGNWTLNLADITLAYPDNFKLSTNLVFDITCNLVQSYSYTKTRTVTLSSVSLTKFFIDSKPKVNVCYLPGINFTKKKFGMSFCQVV